MSSPRMSAYSIRTSRCRGRIRGRPACSAASAPAWPSRCVTSARVAKISGARRAARSSGDRSHQLQRSEHLRERLHQRIQAGAGQSAGQHCGRAWRDVRLYRRGRYRTAAECSWGSFNGQPASAAGNAGVYTGANWTNQTFLNFLAIRNPQPVQVRLALYTATNNNAFQSNANALMNNAGFRANALAAGIPANYFVANPNLLGGAFLVTNIGETSTTACSSSFGRRYSRGSSSRRAMRSATPTSPTSRRATRSVLDSRRRHARRPHASVQGQLRLRPAVRSWAALGRERQRPRQPRGWRVAGRGCQRGFRAGG